MLFMPLKNHIFSSLLVTIILCFSNGYILGQKKYNQIGQELNTITTSVPFLLISPDSRAGGMGDAGVASSPDANSMHWNPSKYAFVKKSTGISASYIPWLRQLAPDINIAYLSGYYKMNKNGVLASSIRYFSLGDITFTDIQGSPIGQFRPHEFAIDLGYGTKLGRHFSGGGAIRYVHSNLTASINVANSATHPGNTVAADISGYYEGDEKEIGGKKSILRFGMNISNIGAKISYSDQGNKDFIPINMKFGSSLQMKLDDYNEICFLLDVNKLLVPTPPVYKVDASGNPIKNPDGSQVIDKGSNPNRGIVSGMFGSFSDAPGGFNEELREFNLGGGLEYWYAKQFAFRAGYFNEPATKGGRKYFTLGLGVKYSVFGFDFAYLIPTSQRHPLQNTLRFSLLFDFDAFNSSDEGEQAN